MTSLLSRLQKNTTKKNLKEINGLDTNKEREEAADIMCDVLSLMDTPANMSRLEAETKLCEKAMLAYTGNLSDKPLTQIRQLGEYISHLIKEIESKNRKASLHTIVRQIAYASVLIMDTAERYVNYNEPDPTDMEMTPQNIRKELTTLEPAFSEWIDSLKKNEQYFYESLKKQDKRRIFEACANYGWIGSTQDELFIITYLEENKL